MSDPPLAQALSLHCRYAIRWQGETSLCSSWLIIGIPLLWGITKTLVNALQLFR